ncbi:zinc ribbon domain-containing protein [Opitutaceae bacterium TAV4]|uniref:zinc ribbon domain-containing protein n=1 Tax=Geminisphaera colitermitum TaxID=1148786 RepID=UPI0001965533|nr:zinc ribbon domain-containing protein [Geminisphaera colitermitum]RRJ96315.1 zinc ribbon domain-containing protein [Opitutaceae bacterium TAV4]RRK00460.1 zinc ribbon domain-containing protein [Opitutaceae bacterium TAV3]
MTTRPPNRNGGGFGFGNKPPPPPDECAQCGADIPRGALACPECGADERTGWREVSSYDGLDLPDSAWADDDGGGVSERGGEGGPLRIGGIAWYWVVVALVLVVFMIAGFVLR